MVHDMIVQLPITGRWGTDAEMGLRQRLEEEFRTALGELGDVTGGDIGSGNMNIFINQIPEFDPALEKVKGVLARHQVLEKAIIQRSTYEDPEDDPTEQAVAWPLNFTGVFRMF